MFNFIPAYHLPLFILALTGYVLFDQFDQPEYRNGAEVSMYRDLTEEEKHVLINKGTEFPYTGDLLNNKSGGTYSCMELRGGTLSLKFKIRFLVRLAQF